MTSLIYKRLLIFLLPATLICGLFSCRGTEKTEAITAEITAAQMEGRRAAGLILGPEWKDTIQLQRALLEVKSRQSQYLIDGHPECGAAFDSTFISTIRSVNPALAKKLGK